MFTALLFTERYDGSEDAEGREEKFGLYGPPQCIIIEEENDNDHFVSTFNEIK